MATHPRGRLVLAIDQGTTSSRAIIFDAAGAPVAVSQKEHRQHFPAPAWVEHDAEEIWARVSECITAALAEARARPHDVAACGITNQRETVVVWDPATGTPLYNALVWQDQRGAPLCDELAAEGGRDRYRHKTGLPLVPYFTASKLRWLLDNVPGLRARADAGTAIAGTMDSYLLWKLTGRHETDVTNASRTLLCNIHTLTWDDELCAAFNVPRRMLPAIRPSSHVFGVCLPHSPLPGVVVGGILGDQQSALFGQACFEPGDAKNTYGTGCFLLLNTGGTAVPSHHGLLTTVAYQLAGQAPVYALEGSVAVAGAVVSWLRDALGLIAQPADAEALALSVPDNGGVAFVPAFNGLFAPHWRSDARGIIIGLSGSTHRGHIARAALEAVGFQSRELLEAMAKDARRAVGGAPGSAARAALRAGPLRVDGGMSSNSTLMQFQADVSGRAVVRPAVSETTALGAAYAAGLAVGVWSSTADLKLQWREAARWEPAMSPAAAHALVRRWDVAVSRSLGWATVGAAAPGDAAGPAARDVGVGIETAAAAGAGSEHGAHHHHHGANGAGGFRGRVRALWARGRASGALRTGALVLAGVAVGLLIGRARHRAEVRRWGAHRW